jgi:hypothetical protein
MFTDQQKAKCVLRYEFYESSAAVRRKFRTFYHMCIIIKLQEKIQYCIGCKTSEPVSLNFCDQRNIAFSLGV